MADQKKPRPYAEGTSVPVANSKAEIERILGRYGADQFMYGIKEGMALIMFRAHGRHVRFVLPLAKTNEAEERRRWRCMTLVIKSKLEAVATGIVEFQDEFMAHIVMPDGRTVSDHAKPMIETAYKSGQMHPLLPDYSKKED